MRSRLPRVALAGKALAAALLVISLAGISLQVHPAAAATQGDAIVQAAASKAGVPYCDNGGGPGGPSYGGVNETGCPTGTAGFDCMSLAQYAVYQGTGIALPAVGWNGTGTVIPPNDTTDLQPGDIVYWGGDGSLAHYVHSGVYVDSGHVWDAIGVGVPVQTHSMAELASAYSNVYDGAVRYWTVGAPPPPPPPPGPGSNPAPTPNGYDLVGSDGGVFVFGGGFYGSLPGLGIRVNNITGIVPIATKAGYFLVGSDGGVFAFNAPFANSLPGIGVHVNNIRGIVPTLSDQGYFLVGSDGGVFSFNAPFENSLPGIGIHVNDITGIAATADDNGYWLVGSNGAVYAFGDAHFYGSAPAGAVGITATHDGGGYWVVGANGAVTPFGDAGKFSDLPSLGVSVDNIVGIVVSADSKGYNLIGSDGGVFSFGDAVNEGSLPGLAIHVGNVVGAVPT